LKPFYYRLTLNDANAKQMKRRTILIERSTPISGNLITGTEITKDGSRREVETKDAIATFSYSLLRSDLKRDPEPLEMSMHYGALVLAGQTEPI